MYPQTRHQLIAREHTRGLLARNQSRSNSFAVSRQRPPLRTSRVACVELERRRTRAARSRGVRGVGAAQHRAHARSELARRERLRHVVVGAELEPDDPVRLLAPRREHDHGELGVRRGSNGRARGHPFPAASRRGRRGRARRARSARARRSPSAASSVRWPSRCEVADDDFAHDRLVVDDEDGGHRPILSRARLRRDEISVLSRAARRARR